MKRRTPRRVGRAPSIAFRVLWAQLETAGWGELRGDQFHSVRAVFEALVRHSRDGLTIGTAWQVAEWSGRSLGHTRRCLHVLERMGLLDWTRGHIAQGRPRPGWFQLRRDPLAQAVSYARDLQRVRRAHHKADTDHRIKTTVRNHSLWPRKSRRNPLSEQANTTTTLPYEVGQGGADPDAQPPTESDDDMRQPCIHAMPDINQCGMCQVELRRNPDMDVRTLWGEKTQQRGDAARGREACRAAVRQSKHSQDVIR